MPLAWNISAPRPQPRGLRGNGRARRGRTGRALLKVCSLRPSRVAIPGVGEVLGNRRQHRELAPSVRRGARAGAGRAGTHRPPAILRSRAGECWDAVGSWPVSRRRGACFYRTRRSCGGFRWGGRSLRRRSRWHGRGAARRESVPCNPPPGPDEPAPRGDHHPARGARGRTVEVACAEYVPKFGMADAGERVPHRRARRRPARCAAQTSHRGHGPWE
jgi:hypothetical protein